MNEHIFSDTDNKTFRPRIGHHSGNSHIFQANSVQCIHHFLSPLINNDYDCMIMKQSYAFLKSNQIKSKCCVICSYLLLLLVPFFHFPSASLCSIFSLEFQHIHHAIHLRRNICITIHRYLQVDNIPGGIYRYYHKFFHLNRIQKPSYFHFRIL